MLPPNVGSPPPNTNLPPDLIVQFWEEVYGELQTAHQLSGPDAVTAIMRFRAAADHDVGDMIYHRNPGDVADTIAAGWRNGAWPAAASGRTGTTP